MGPATRYKFRCNTVSAEYNEDFIFSSHKILDYKSTEPARECHVYAIDTRQGLNPYEKRINFQSLPRVRII